MNMLANLKLFINFDTGVKINIIQFKVFVIYLTHHINQILAIFMHIEFRENKEVYNSYEQFFLNRDNASRTSTQLIKAERGAKESISSLHELQRHNVFIFFSRILYLWSSYLDDILLLAALSSQIILYYQYRIFFSVCSTEVTETLTIFKKMYMVTRQGVHFF